MCADLEVARVQCRVANSDEGLTRERDWHGVRWEDFKHVDASMHTVGQGLHELAG